MLPELQIADQTLLAYVLDLALKSSVLLLLAGAVATLLKRASAATRHWVWSFAVFGVLSLPLLTGVLPAWQVPLLPTVTTAQVDLDPTPVATPDVGATASNDRARRAAESPSFSLEKGSETAVVAPRVTPPTPTEATPPLGFMAPATVARPELVVVEPTPSATGGGLPWPSIAMLGWLAGALLVLGRLLLGMSWVRWMSKTAQPIDAAPWQALLRECRAYLGIERNVALWRGFHSTTPMTWGILRPVVLLPHEAEGWDLAMRRVVLLHELAHIKRKDTFIQLVTQCACALWWFNPLIWIAARQLRVEREHACDDCVLTSGARASEYAKHLLDIARGLRAARVASLATIAMARRSQLEGRLLAILNPRQNRRALTPLGTGLLVTVMALVVVPLAAVQPWAPLASTVVTVSDRTTLSLIAPADAPQAGILDRLANTPVRAQNPVPNPVAIYEEIATLQNDGLMAPGASAGMSQAIAFQDHLDAFIDELAQLLRETTRHLDALSVQVAAGDEQALEQAHESLNTLGEMYKKLGRSLASVMDALARRGLSDAQTQALEARVKASLEIEIEALGQAAEGLANAVEICVERWLDGHLDSMGGAVGQIVRALTHEIKQQLIVEVKIEIVTEIQALLHSLRLSNFQPESSVGEPTIQIHTHGQTSQLEDHLAQLDTLLQGSADDLLQHIDDEVASGLEGLGESLEKSLDDWLDTLLD